MDFVRYDSPGRSDSAGLSGDRKIKKYSVVAQTNLERQCGQRAAASYLCRSLAAQEAASLIIALGEVEYST